MPNQESSYPQHGPLPRVWLTDVEKGRLTPGIFKIATLSRLYDLTVAAIHAMFGIEPGDITEDRYIFGAPKTHLLIPRDDSVSAVTPDSQGVDPGAEFENTNILSRLVDIWGEVPMPVLRRLDLRRFLYGYIGTKDATMSPLLPPGTFVWNRTTKDSHCFAVIFFRRVSCRL